MFRGILQQVGDDFFHMLPVDFHGQLRRVDGYGNLLFHVLLDSLRQAFTESQGIGIFQFIGLGEGVFQHRQLFDVCRKGFQCLHGRQRRVEGIKGRGHLCGDVPYELCLQGIVLVCRLNHFPLLAVLCHETQQDDTSQHQRGGKDGGKDAQPHDDVLACGQRAVFLLDGLQAVLIARVQFVVFLLGGKCLYRVVPRHVLVVGACHHRRVACPASFPYHFPVAGFGFGIVLLPGVAVYQGVECRVALAVHAECVVVKRLRIEQVGVQRVVLRRFRPVFQACQLVFRPAGAALLEVYLQAFPRDGVAQGRQGFPALLLAGYDGLLHGAEQLEGFLVVVLPVVQGACLYAACHSLVVLCTCGICIVGLQEQVARFGVVFLS